MLACRRIDASSVKYNQLPRSNVVNIQHLGRLIVRQVRRRLYTIEQLLGTIIDLLVLVPRDLDLDEALALLR